MRRIIVVGPPGSGKSTLARRLGHRLGIPHTEMDDLFWEPNWTEADRSVFRHRVRAAAARDAWVLDGNYFSAGAVEEAWPRADTVVWLDLPLAITLPRAVWRTLRRAARREELWSSRNRESLRLMLSRDSLIWYSIRHHGKYRARYDPLSRGGGSPHLTWVRLRSPRQVRRWLRSLPTAS